MSRAQLAVPQTLAVPPLYLRAAWVVPVAGAPIQDGALLIGTSGRIDWIGPADARTPPEAATRLTFPNGVVLPGFINVHTHLELTHLEALISEMSFPSWLLALRRLKDGTQRSEFDAAACLGVLDMWRQGVTTVADTGSSGAAARALDRLGGSGIVYQEVFGPHPNQAGEALAGLGQTLDRLSRQAPERVRLGVSPHAAFTISDALARAAFALADRRGLRIAMHVAESPDETLFVAQGAGSFAEQHKSRGIPVAPKARSTVQWMKNLALLDQHPLCIHAVATDESDARLLADHGAPVAHCPLSNTAHGHGQAPLGLWRATGVHVGLGTDSVASQAPLDLRAEARATGLAAEDQLELLTAGGARVLELCGEVGSLVIGAWGDVAVFEHRSDTPTPPGAWEHGRVICTIVAGRVVYDGAAWPGVDATAWRTAISSARRRLESIAAGSAAPRSP